ncbi:FCD domain-containing protein [Ruegeria marina]|uniref:FCD domain-containing protein n=1 Tax=Ruegeria marina TaxID=639004 RepID=A0A1G6I344_9RHOB|nr:FCD domain-containing protein [Ruegeria marina]
MDTIRPKKTLTEETYDILVEAICSGELKPGERLTQDEIAARLNVSRQPVNSAISILKTNRLVEDTGRRGVVVAPIDPMLFASIYELRLAIEPFVLRLAAKRMPATAAEEGRQIMAEGAEALASGSVRAVVDADMHFH